MTGFEIKTLLSTYVELILKCENILKEKYEIEEIPYANQKKLPKRNEINSRAGLLKYNFHGAGCTFFLSEVELSYDVDLTCKNYLVTSPWKYSQFLNSYLILEDRIKEEEVDSFFLQFEKEGILDRVMSEYWNFRINFDWFYSKSKISI